MKAYNPIRWHDHLALLVTAGITSLSLMSSVLLLFTGNLPAVEGPSAATRGSAGVPLAAAAPVLTGSRSAPAGS